MSFFTRYHDKLVIIVFLLLCVNIVVFKKRHPRQISRNYEVPPRLIEQEPKEEPPKKLIVPEFVKVPIFRQSEKDSVFGDVLSHSEEKPFGGSNRSTNAHETGHGIHSYLRNKYTGIMHKKVNGFYALKDRGVIIEEPKIRKSQIAKFVPQSLHSYRYDLYIAGQKEWDDTPLYIYDEWNAYILGGKTNVDDVISNRYKGEWIDGVSGCIDFSFYAIATAMAIKQHDPEYWNSNKQYRDFTIWNLKEAHETYLVGHKMKWFKWDKQDALLRAFLTSSDAIEMRRFVKDNLEGVWLNTELAETNLHYEPYQQELEEVVMKKQLVRALIRRQ